MGQKIKTLFEGFQDNQYGRIVWDATDHLGLGVPAGVYIYSLNADGISINKKMSLIDGRQGITNMPLPGPVAANTASNKQMSDQYRLRITGNDIETYEQQNLLITGNMVLNATVFRKIPGFVFVQGGTFQMGDTFGDGYAWAKPVHSVTLRSFYVSKYEVTQSLYQSVTGSNPSFFTGDSNRPVEQVSWYNAVNFCNALSQQDGLTPCYTVNGANTTCNFNANGYRLGTEAEWEYAARGGNQSQGYKYSGSDTLDNVAWYWDNSGSQTHPVGMKAPNELGVYDMSGNVLEWCWDWYGSYSSEAQADPTGSSSGSDRVLRGDGWLSFSHYARVVDRYAGVPSSRHDDVGFRLFRTGE